MIQFELYICHMSKKTGGETIADWLEVLFSSIMQKLFL